MRNKGKWIARGIFALLFIFLLVWVVKAYTSKEEPVVRPAEQVVPAAESYIGSVENVGISNGLLVAHVNSPSAGSLHWENSQGMVSSDTITWEAPMIGDIELSPMGPVTGLRPVLTTPQGVVKGNPIP